MDDLTAQKFASLVSKYGGSGDSEIILSGPNSTNSTRVTKVVGRHDGAYRDSDRLDSEGFGREATASSVRGGDNIDSRFGYLDMSNQIGRQDGDGGDDDDDDNDDAVYQRHFNESRSALSSAREHEDKKRDMFRELESYLDELTHKTDSEGRLLVKQAKNMDVVANAMTRRDLESDDAHSWSRQLLHSGGVNVGEVAEEFSSKKNSSSSKGKDKRRGESKIPVKLSGSKSSLKSSSGGGGGGTKYGTDEEKQRRALEKERQDFEMQQGLAEISLLDNQLREVGRRDREVKETLSRMESLRIDNIKNKHGAQLAGSNQNSARSDYSEDAPPSGRSTGSDTSGTSYSDFQNDTSDPGTPRSTASGASRASSKSSKSSASGLFMTRIKKDKGQTPSTSAKGDESDRDEDQSMGGNSRHSSRPNSGRSAAAFSDFTSSPRGSELGDDPFENPDYEINSAPGSARSTGSVRSRKSHDTSRTDGDEGDNNNREQLELNTNNNSNYSFSQLSKKSSKKTFNGSKRLADEDEMRLNLILHEDYDKYLLASDSQSIYGHNPYATKLLDIDKKLEMFGRMDRLFTNGGVGGGPSVSAYSIGMEQYVPDVVDAPPPVLPAAKDRDKDKKKSVKFAEAPSSPSKSDVAKTLGNVYLEDQRRYRSMKEYEAKIDKLLQKSKENSEIDVEKLSHKAYMDGFEHQSDDVNDEAVGFSQKSLLQVPDFEDAQAVRPVSYQDILRLLEELKRSRDQDFGDVLGQDESDSKGGENDGNNNYNNNSNNNNNNNNNSRENIATRLNLGELDLMKLLLPFKEDVERLASSRRRKVNTEEGRKAEDLVASSKSSLGVDEDGGAYGDPRQDGDRNNSNFGHTASPPANPSKKKGGGNSGRMKRESRNNNSSNYSSNSYNDNGSQNNNGSNSSCQDTNFNSSVPPSNPLFDANSLIPGGLMSNKFFMPSRSFKSSVSLNASRLSLNQQFDIDSILQQTEGRLTLPPVPSKPSSANANLTLSQAMSGDGRDSSYSNNSYGLPGGHGEFRVSSAEPKRDIIVSSSLDSGIMNNFYSSGSNNNDNNNSSSSSNNKFIRI